jgi:isopenicillin-N epimerase
MMNRRNLLSGIAMLRPGAAALAFATGRGDARPASEVARDEDYWREIQQAFAVDRTIINLNNGGVSPSPRIVQDALRRYQEYSNLAPVQIMWRELEPRKESVRVGIARLFGCDPEEIALTRNASEALEIVQLGLDLKRGDEVITTDQDYPRMITTWKQREKRDGIVLKQLAFPTPPASPGQLVELFEQAITPRTRVLHFCQVTNLTGQIFPVRDLCRLARRRGIEAIVDGAHAFAHFPFQQSDLECDYYGTSLHKWLLAPIGTGFLYVRKEKIPKLWPLFGAMDPTGGDIRKFEEIGTHPAANHNAIAEAILFHDGIGGERKAERLRYLRRYWTRRLSQLPGVGTRTSDDPAQSCGLGLLTIEGRDVGEIGAELWRSHRIVSTPIKRDDYSGIRITPNVYTTLRELDVFCDAVEKIVHRSSARG